MRWPLCCILLTCGTLLAAAPATAEDPAAPQAWTPWAGTEAANLLTQAKADFAARDFDGTIEKANRYLDIAEPTARVQALLGRAYFKKTLYALAVEHLQAAIVLAHTNHEPVRQDWIDLLRQSGGAVPEEAAATAPAAPAAAPVRRNPQGEMDDAACRRKGLLPGTGAYAQCRLDLVTGRNQQVSPADAAAAAQGQVLYNIEAQRAQTQGQTLSEIRGVEHDVAVAHAQAATPTHNEEIDAIARERMAAQAAALDQLHAAQSEVGRNRALTAPQGEGYALQAQDADRQAAVRDALKQRLDADSARGQQEVVPAR